MISSSSKSRSQVRRLAKASAKQRQHFAEAHGDLFGLPSVAADFQRVSAGTAINAQVDAPWMLPYMPWGESNSQWRSILRVPDGDIGSGSYRHIGWSVAEGLTPFVRKVLTFSNGAKGWRTMSIRVLSNGHDAERGGCVENGKARLLLATTACVVLKLDSMHELLFRIPAFQPAFSCIRDCD